MRCLTGPDAERQRTHPTMRAGVAVGAHDQHSRVSHAQLGTDHVHDALTGLPEVEQPNAGVCAATTHLAQQSAARRIGVGHSPRNARNRVVGCGEREIRPADLTAVASKTCQIGSRLEIVDQVPVDVEQRHVARQHGDLVR